MSLCLIGLTNKFEKTTKITLTVTPSHRLIKLANALDWQRLSEIILPDLQQTTTKRKWWLGRKLTLRVHLGAYLLQQLLNETDRGIEEALRFNPAYQVFCGRTFVKKWHCPDHTKIEAFRSRLSPQTHIQLANEIAKAAVRFGFANPEHIDIDSTVQAPNMQHPALSNLLIKLAVKAKQARKIVLDKLNLSKTSLPAEINLKTIKGIAREYFFLKGKKVKAIALKRKAALQKLWRALHDSVQPTLNYLPLLLEPYLFASFNSRTQHALTQLAKKAQALLTFAYDRCFDQHSEKACRFYSLHLDQVSCFNKGKLKRELEFGRQFQIDRLQGNFVWSIPNNSIRMPDAESLKPMVRAHLHLFQTIPKSIATDKGYYAKNNERFMLDLGIDHVGLQRCNRVYADPPDNPIDQEQQQALINRRAGIEPIIGHLKQNWQMGRSRMKSDRTTESAGFCALLGFNLRQLTRYLTGETKPVASL